MKSAPLQRAAGQLWMKRTRPCALAPLILMTDPTVHSDPIAAAENMPVGSAIIYRHFGAENRHEITEKLRQKTFERKQQLLIGNDPELAIEVGADGVHFTRDANLTAPTIWRNRCPEWTITMAGLKGDYTAYLRDLSVLDALFVSSIFESSSPSAGMPIGAERLQGICRELAAPIIALGGVTPKRASELTDSGVAGLSGRFIR